MKQQEEKKTMKSTSSTFPIDLTLEILSRLPEKSIVRFRCVSKLWSSITTDAYFINLFETRNPRPSLLLCLVKDKEFLVTSIPQQLHTLSNQEKKYSVERYHTKLPEEHSYLLPTESVQGLITFQGTEKPLIWNPSTRQFLTLPKPSKSWNALKVFLGYDPIEGKHKVLCFPFLRYSTRPRVFTLGSAAQAQESWRTVQTNHKHRSTSHSYTYGRCLNGVIYYVAYCFHKRDFVVMSFDVRYERFDMIQLPSGIHYKTALTTYKGRLAIVELFYTKMGNKLWLLEDAEKHKWSNEDFLDQQSKSLAGLEPNGFTHDGEFVYVPSKFSKPCDILFYNPERKSFRTFRFQGDYENVHGYQFHAFPNHMESQMCL